MPRRICGEGLSEADRLVGYRSSLAAEVAQLREAVAALLAPAPAAPAPRLLAPSANRRRHRSPQAQGGA